MTQALIDQAMALARSGKFTEAETTYRRALALQPGNLAAGNNLGAVLSETGRFDEAIAVFRHAISFNPFASALYYNLGKAFHGKGHLSDAVESYRRAIALDPKSYDAHTNLGNELQLLCDFDGAFAELSLAVKLRPEDSFAHYNLGNVLRDVGEMDQALAAYDRAIALRPDDPLAADNRIFALLHHSGADAATMYNELRLYNTRHAEPLKQFIRPHANDRNPDRKLRVGYVSPDFRKHVVGWNLLPLLRNHDHTHFEIICYSSVTRPDEMTQALHATTDIWHDVENKTDAQLDDIIRNDRIDILVDLSVHSSRNRLLLFARKPAPVQVTYLGYAGSTGLDTMDYRISDPHLDPPQTDLSVYSEKTIRLSRSYWCYNPGIAAPDVSPLPAAQSGVIAFACLNNPAKVSPATLDIWAAILAAVPTARLILHAWPGRQRQRFTTHLRVSPDRIEFLPRQSFPSYLQTFARSDISLDPFPYNGGITTCDSLYMGVPVVTLSGQTAVARAGRSILNNVGLPELVAQTPEQYIQIARDLAADLPRLSALRATLRQRMTSSPLMDAKSFAREVESAYRTMWEARP